MSLDLLQVLPQVQELGRDAALRARSQADKIRESLEVLLEIAELDPQSVIDAVEQTGDQWRGAALTTERMDASFPPPPMPATLNVIGSDGSQIYVDRHSPILYFLVNVGSIWIPYGSGANPQTFSHPHIFHHELQLWDEQGRFVSATIIDKARDAEEIHELARLAERFSDEPTLALLDNNLQMYAGVFLRDRISTLMAAALERYQTSLNRLRKVGAALAGFIDRSQSSDLLRLLSLVKWGERHNRYPRLMDRDLFVSLLPPKHRSATFRLSSPDGISHLGSDLTIYFFYLNIGSEGQIARVEVPEWVVKNPALMNHVHAGILKECQATDGFPYSLIRAHELALVSDRERRALDHWITTICLRHGLQLQPSQKAKTKRWLSKQRHHGL
ncbi:MAG TPA: DNA double-strand break repair nuclease NurA [Anaerolineae bacterium]|nr:DNA double-strand break repair nuclease NurA [Anaerolineae bacterium]